MALRTDSSSSIKKIDELLAEGIPAILKGLNPTAKQKAAAPKAIEATMLRLAAA